MLDTLSFSVNAILPLVLLILLGYGVRRLGFFGEDALKQLNRFNFRVPFCALMFVNIYNMDLSRGIPVPVRLVGQVVLAIVILTVLGLVFAQVLTKERARKGVLVQAMFRSNSAIIGLPLSESVAGAAGLATATVFQLPVVIYFNAMSVVMLSLYSRSEEKPKAGKVFAGVLKNPLIQGLLAGALALVIRQFIPVGADGLPVFSIRYSLPWLSGPELCEPGRDSAGPDRARRTDAFFGRVAVPARTDLRRDHASRRGAGRRFRTAASGGADRLYHAEPRGGRRADRRVCVAAVRFRHGHGRADGCG